MASDFTGTDIKIIISMVIAILIISHTMPLLGMGGEPADPDDFPELDIGSSTFDFAGDMPEFRPEGPTSGFITDSVDGPDADNSRWLYRADSGVFSDAEGVRIGTAHGESDITVSLDKFEGDDAELVESDEHTFEFDDVGEREQLEVDDNNTVVIVELVDSEPEPASEGGISTVQFDVQGSAEPAGLFDWVPLIGGAASALAGIVGYLTSMFFWLSMIIVEYFINIFVVIATIGVYAVEIIDFMIGGYFNVIGEAHGFATIVLAVPGLLLTLELLKIGLVLVNALWLG